MREHIGQIQWRVCELKSLEAQLSKREGTLAGKMHEQMEAMEGECSRMQKQLRAMKTSLVQSRAMTKSLSVACIADERSIAQVGVGADGLTFQPCISSSTQSL